GGFQNQGAVTLGYRFADIKGYQPQFLQLFDLQKGFRLQDFNMFGESEPGVNPFADTYSLSASGLGGDPFPTAQLTLSKTRLNDEANRFTGGIDYTLRSWTLHYNLGYQTFNENLNLNNVASPERSIDTSAAITANEPLLGLSWSQSRRLTTPVSEFSFTGKPF